METGQHKPSSALIFFNLQLGKLGDYTHQIKNAKFHLSNVGGSCYKNNVPIIEGFMFECVSKFICIKLIS